jgi:hypothetical protein
MNTLAANITAAIYSMVGLCAAITAAAWIVVQHERRVLLWIFLAGAVFFFAQSVEQLWTVAFRLSALGLIPEDVMRGAVGGGWHVILRKLLLALAPALYATAIVAALRGQEFWSATRWMGLSATGVIATYLGILIALQRAV